MKETEGNPQIKARIRRLQRDLARRKMMKEVPKATAVIVNPTHYAVAIRYEMESMAAPLVVAKGKNYLALRIRQMAVEHQVPIVENPPLAQALYKSADVGQEIPPHLYRAVAEILAYIFKLMHGRQVDGAAARVPTPRRSHPLAPRPRRSSRCQAAAPRASLGANWREFAVPLAVLGIVLAMITPLPPFLLDLLISANIMLSVMVLMVSLYLTKPVEFSVFPTTLLLLTLFRLALNISSSRLILLNGNTGTAAAGRSDRGLRQLRGGRQLRHRRGDLPGADRHPVRGHQPRRGAHFGSDGALHPGRPARQTDVHRFGPERRADRRNTKPSARRKTAGQRSRVLRRHGRRLALHAARRGGQHPDHRHQHRGRLPDRRAAARHGSCSGRSRPTPS